MGTEREVVEVPANLLAVISFFSTFGMAVFLWGLAALSLRILERLA